MTRIARGGVLGQATIARLAGFVIEQGKALFTNGSTAGEVAAFMTDQGIDHGMAVTRRGWVLYLK
jgi:hypothetical protein